MITKKFKTTIWSLTLLLFAAPAFAQGSRPSPAATATGNVNGANITIAYSSPAVKGRKIWGELVPYDKIWRAGANEATLFKTDKNITVEGRSLAAGAYSIYAVPGKKSWKIIFNSETGQWGTSHEGVSTNNPAKDVLTVVVTPLKSRTSEERLKYAVTPKGMELIWENLIIPVTIR